jgi:gluconate 2-dehydrogenase gamma chain
MHDDDKPALARREFLKGVGFAGVAATTLPFQSSTAKAQDAPAHMEHVPTTVTPPKADAPAAPTVYRFFNSDEAAFVEAAVDTLIPADETGPGGVESGVPVYIDNQLDGRFGGGDRFYLEGPFAEGTPSQGYQLSLTPAELIRAGIADAESYAQQRFGNPTAALTPEQRTVLFQEIEAGHVQFGTVPPAVFFNTLLQLSVEGYFGDPIYGGNRNKGAWKMIGFPGALAMFVDKIDDYRNKPFTAEPVSIQDLS